jgi:hypothetical protein
MNVRELSLVGLVLMSVSIPHRSSASESSAMISAGIPGVMRFAPPPSSFNPLMASNDQLLRYGLPPRPDASKSPKLYAQWMQGMSIRLIAVVPTFTRTTVQHGPARDVPTNDKSRPKNGATYNTTSSNWSGYTILDIDGPFLPSQSTTSIASVGAELAVPKATCTQLKSGQYWSSQWVGFDGFVSRDVVQAGVTADLSCPAAMASYYLWMEWFPAYEIKIGTFPVAPGDELLIMVMKVDTTSTARVFIESVETGNYTSLQLNAPAGVNFVGDSAEWIVERPAINGTVAALANYWVVLFRYAAATATNSTTYTPGIAPTGSIFNISMVDNSQVQSKSLLAPIPSENTDILFWRPSRHIE